MPKEAPKAPLPATVPAGRVRVTPQKNPNGLLPTNRSVASVNPAAQKRKGT